VVKHIRIALGALMLSVIGLLALGGLSPAQAADTAVIGVLTTPGGDPVEGVVITVSNEEGFTESGTSDATGAFRVPLPSGGHHIPRRNRFIARG
jgi:hypothetical protein